MKMDWLAFPLIVIAIASCTAVRNHAVEDRKAVQAIIEACEKNPEASFCKGGASGILTGLKKDCD